MKKGSQYHIRNWADYNKSLVQRGSLTVWFSEDALKTWIEELSSKTKKGRPRIYSDEAIMSALIIREVFHLPLRALQGFLLSLVSLLRLAIPISPHYSRICRRNADLGAQIKRLSKKRPMAQCLRLYRSQSLWRREGGKCVSMGRVSEELGKNSILPSAPTPTKSLWRVSQKTTSRIAPQWLL